MTTEDSGHTARAVIGNDDWLPGQIVETPEGTVGDDTQWYRDAVIYQTHIKAFYDSNGDGVGDINGLIEKLDHIRELGATAIWLLPFYPSPLRDDGYDIQDYRTVNPSYGRMADMRRLVKAVHARGLRLITELVINHTSDQHPWFQRARNSPKGSRYRDYYVWSDNDERYQGTRIIFLDTEKSNWTWDPVAKAYYWHRFYSHQPDLNFDNPRVVDEVIAVLHYWMKLGVDGLRLDAVPYLIEREGTNCENLPETHDILRRMRAEVDAHFPGRMLLAEANQWPEDTRPYFGDGDECHMAFHFPLMPRMYLSVAREDRHPITDIMRQTPSIPEGCQWAIFLRNHDELTLEMVTDRERDYLWSTYAEDRRMRINLGIRRRLAPLMGNDRRKIELMNSMLLSMPGTPVIYYGDEIGMGDNVYLGDRDGVRTPMQWSPDRNAGFSSADPQRLFLPTIMDAVYGYQAVNVEAQLNSSSSLLRWMQRLIGIRQSYRAFARGSLRFLFPGNRKILAYLRELGDEALLCVVNLSRHAQPVELDLSEFEGRVPVELMGRNAFPPIGELRYLLTLPSHGFYWFLLEKESVAPPWHQVLPEPVPDMPTIVTRSPWKFLEDDGARTELERDALSRFVPAQRWYGEIDRDLSSVTIEDHAPLGSGARLLGLGADYADGTRTRFWLPLALAWDEQASASGTPLQPFVAARLRSGPRVGALVDATVIPRFATSLIEQMSRSDGGGALVGEATPELAVLAPQDEDDVRRLSGEQSNTSVIVGDKIMLKLYRRREDGVNPEVEISRFLTSRTSFDRTPALLGALHWRDERAGESTVAAAFRFVTNQGDAWQAMRESLEHTLETTLPVSAAETAEGDGDEDTVLDPFARDVALASVVGRRTAELHVALASVGDDPAFAPASVSRQTLRHWAREAQSQHKAVIALARRLRRSGGETRPPGLEILLDSAPALREQLERVAALPTDFAMTRIHGDYHLGQVLVTEDDCVILDFEGEPARPLEARRRKASPLQDVAGMIRSFDYLRRTVLQRLGGDQGATQERIEPMVDAWHGQCVRAFVTAYREGAEGSPGVPSDPAVAAALLRHFMLHKALYEVGYEAANRPRWLAIPTGGIAALLAGPDATLKLWEGEDE